MNQDITLYGFAPSTYVRTARLVCEEKSIPYTLEPGGFGTPAFLELNPFGKMPAMRHGDLVVGETLAIASYLDQRFDTGPRLIPEGAAERARVLAWSSAAIDYLYDAAVRSLLGAMKSGEPLSPDQVERSRAVLATFDRGLDGGVCLVGGEVTLADLYLWPMLAFASGQPAGKALVADFRNLAGALDAAASRPSFARTAG